MSAIQEKLTETEFQAAWHEGQDMTLEQAIENGLQVCSLIPGQHLIFAQREGISTL